METLTSSNAISHDEKKTVRVVVQMKTELPETKVLKYDTEIVLLNAAIEKHRRDKAEEKKKETKIGKEEREVEVAVEFSESDDDNYDDYCGLGGGGGGGRNVWIGSSSKTPH
jgi:hypothetical protein